MSPCSKPAPDATLSHMAAKGKENQKATTKNQKAFAKDQKASAKNQKATAKVSRGASPSGRGMAMKVMKAAKAAGPAPKQTNKTHNT